jgi:hypothetical protein
VHVCPLDWCAKKYQSESGLWCHIKNIHRRPSPSWVKPSAAALNDFTSKALTEIQDVLSRTPRRTIGRNRSGGAFEKVEVDCSRAVFLELFENCRGFRMSQDQQRFKVVFSGFEGRDELEGILGQEFWKFTFDDEDRSQCLVFFYSYSSKQDHSLTISWRAKVIPNQNPAGSLIKERAQIKFKRYRTRESEEDRAHCIALTPVVYVD